MTLAVQTRKIVPDVAVDQLFERLAVRERDKLLQITPIGGERMS